MKKTFSRALSVILAVVMLAVSIPMALAAEQISLTEANVLTWPTIIGDCNYGEEIGKAFTITGGEVKYGDVVVPGHFEFDTPTATPKANVAYNAVYKFVPDDENMYSSFVTTATNEAAPKLAINKTVPVLADPNNPPTASAVDVNSPLSASTISGGTMINPYTGATLNTSRIKWKWVTSSTTVSISGEYDAYFSVTGTYASCYERVEQKIYVHANGSAAEITELPTIDSFDYDSNITWNNIEIKGGTANVSGKFYIADKFKNETPLAGTYNIDVTFIPDDETIASTTIQVPVTVNAATVKFVDESGSEIVPEITIDRILTVGDDLNGYLKPYLNASCSFNYEETEGYGEKIKPGTHEYTVKTISDDPNYERYSTLTFKIVLNKEKVNAKVKNVVGGKQIYIEGGDTYHLNGNFDVKYFIDGKEAGIIEGIKLNEKFEIKQNKSGVYTYEIVYNGTEDDYYDITVITEAEDIKLQHQVKVVGQEAVTYKYGDTVTINAPAHEKPYYEFTGWVNESGITLSDEQRSAESINTTMPDNDIELEATYKFSIKLFFEWVLAQITQFFTFIVNAVKDLIALV